MRAALFRAGCCLACVALAAPRAGGQNESPPTSPGHAAGSYYAPSSAPPRLAPAPPVEARPLLPEPTPREQPPATTPAFPIRLSAAETPLSPPRDDAPRRLAPRSKAKPAERGGLSRPQAPTAGGALGTVAGSLGVVLGLFLLVAWFSRRLTPSGSGRLPQEAVELLGRAPLLGRHQVQLVRIGNKLLLVALTPSGAETLTEISQPAEVEHLTALCRRGRPGSSTTAFREVLQELASEPTAGGFAGSARASQRGAR